MKKWTILLTVCFLCILGVSAITPEADGYVYNYYGDMNGDKSYDVEDVLLVLRTILNNKKTDFALADANLDGKATLMDVIKTLRIAVGQEAPAKVADPRYYPETYLVDWQADELLLSAGNTTAKYSAAYTDDGVCIAVTVIDPYMHPTDRADRVSVLLQATRGITYADRRTVRISCHADGKTLIERYNNGDGFVQESPAPDAASCVYARTETGYTLTAFASYDFLKMPKEYAYGKIRVLPFMQNDTEEVHYDLLACEPETPDLWPVLCTDGTFRRDDFSVFRFADSIPTGHAHASLAFLDSLATIKSSYDLKTTKIGVPMFTDRAYSFEAQGLPAELIGTTVYPYGKIGGSSVTVTEAGYVVLAVGELAAFDSINAQVKGAGWELLVPATSNLMNIAVYRRDYDYANWYVKYCEVGETVAFGKWSIPFAKGESNDPFLWETEIAHLYIRGKDDYYSADDYYTLARRCATNSFQAGPTVTVTNGGRLIAGWLTGGTGEPQPENFTAFALSDDGGKTWQEFGALDTYKSTDPQKITKVNDTQVWVDPETNILYFFYKESSTIASFEKNSMVWTFTVENPDDPVTEWRFSEHRHAFPGLLRNNVTVLSDGTWLAAPNYYFDNRYTVVFASTDKGMTWTERGKAYIPQALNFDETSVVELSDGTLWMTVRTTKQAGYQAFSFDKGYTWTMGSASNIPNPSSRFQVFRLDNTTLVRVFNDSPTSRRKMTVSVSYDDGATWIGDLVLYAYKCTYPDFTVEKDGTIHILFDSDRYKSSNSWKDENGKVCWGAIYHVALTKEQIAAGGTLAVSDLDIVSVLTE